MSRSHSSQPRAIEPLAWPADATLTMPGSKSEANRMLVLAALAGKPVTLRAVAPGDDVQRMLQGLKVLGYGVEVLPTNPASIIISPRSANPPTTGIVDCGNAGTALRFLTSLAAITPGEWTLTGDPRMQQRPIAPLVAAWRALGIEIHDHNGCPPVHLHGGSAQGGEVLLDASVSSQFASSLMLVGHALPCGLRLRWQGSLASEGYARWTVALLQRHGIRATLDASGATIDPGSLELPPEVTISGDWSSMGIWTCLSFLTGSRIRAANLPDDGHQADAKLDVLLAQLRGNQPVHLDSRGVPDQFLNLAAVAAVRPAHTILQGDANLRTKECDRISAMAKELRKLGVTVSETVDSLHIDGGTITHGACIDPANDHRMAMAFSLLGLLNPEISIENSDCVTKSYAHFFDDLEQVRRQRYCLAVIGMRAAGKSTFAAALAAATGSTWLDTDAEFVRRHGEIGPFVATHGWERFRDLEASILAGSLAPGHIVSTGGGTIERPTSQQLLRERSLPLWLDTPLQLLLQRLGTGPGRPSLTGAPPSQELSEVLSRRLPAYRDLATLRIPGDLPIPGQVELALSLLARHCRPTANTP